MYPTQNRNLLHYVAQVVEFRRRVVRMTTLAVDVALGPTPPGVACTVAKHMTLCTKPAVGWSHAHGPTTDVAAPVMFSLVFNDAGGRAAGIANTLTASAVHAAANTKLAALASLPPVPTTWYQPSAWYDSVPANRSQSKVVHKTRAFHVNHRVWRSGERPPPPHTHTLTHSNTHSLSHTSIRTLTHTHYSHRRAHTHTFIFTHTHSCSHTRFHMHAYTRTHTGTYKSAPTSVSTEIA